LSLVPHGTTTATGDDAEFAACCFQQSIHINQFETACPSIETTLAPVAVPVLRDLCRFRGLPLTIPAMTG